MPPAEALPQILRARLAALGRIRAKFAAAGASAAILASVDRDIASVRERLGRAA